ncbi:MAG TPA: hypothetical protein VFA99_11835 [Acidobacteriaceae bacterium]|nr:hypothetical protein [Acidobacteriaceae bacterium]
MKLRLFVLAAGWVALFAGTSSLQAQDYYDPPAAAQALQELSSQRATATTITFDREMLDAMLGEGRAAGFNGVSFEHYQYPEPAFYIPEEMHALEQAYHAAGWRHLIDANVGPRESASPTKPIADIWFHYAGGDIDHVTVLIRGRKEMNVVRVSGLLRPMDLVHLSGHLGIPKVDPNAVMVPAPPGR